MLYTKKRSPVAGLLPFAVVALVGCSGSDAGPTSADSGPPPKPVVADSTVLTRPAQPLTVSTTLDQTRSTRVHVTTDGGTVTATGADGTRYTLTIPKDALLADQDITLTPIATIDGQAIGSGGPAAAVQFEPEGLRLLTPATLRIDPAKPIPLEDQVAVGWHGAGQDTHLEPLDPKSSAIVLSIVHFSGVGVGLVYLGDGIYGPSAQWSRYTPEEFEDRANQYISQLLAEERYRQLTGQPSDPTVWDKVRAVYEEEWRLVIQPILERSIQDCTYAKANMSKVLSFGHSVSIMGWEDLASDIVPGLLKAADNCWKEQMGQCRIADDSARLAQILSIMRMEALLGNESLKLGDIPVCGSGYTGTFQATVQATPQGGTMTITASVVFTLDHQDNFTQYFKPASGTVSWSVSGPYAGGCTVSGSGTVAVKPTDATLQVTHDLNGVTKYTGSGATNFFDNLTVNCGGQQITIPEAGRITWFNPPLGLITEPGIGAQLTGSREDPTGKWSWNLQLQ